MKVNGFFGGALLIGWVVWFFYSFGMTGVYFSAQIVASFVAMWVVQQVFRALARY